MKAAIITVVVALVAVGGFVLLSGDNNTAENTATNQSAGDQAEEQELQTFTFDQVAIHNNENDCWLIIEASVYDVTEFIPLHDGGDEILRGCGRDATELFNTRTTEEGEQLGDGSDKGQPHSDEARDILADFKIGELATDL